MANKTWIGTDGDYSVAGNWSPSGVPLAGDVVHLPAGAGAISAGLTQSGVALAEFVVEEGYTGLIGSSAGYLQITTTIFRYSGKGVAYIDLSASACSPEIRDSADASFGSRGLYLLGSALNVVNVINGDVGLAARFAETSTAATVRVVGAKAAATLGAGVTLANFYQTGGAATLRCAATVATVWGGELTTLDAGAIATMHVNGGIVHSESTGTITTLNANGGEIDFTGSGATRTVTTLNQNAGSVVTYDPAVLTITTRNAPNGPVRVSYDLAT